MIDRYSLPEMSNIWSLQNQYASWLKVEIAIDEAWSKLGKIPAEDVEKIFGPRPWQSRAEELLEAQMRADAERMLAERDKEQSQTTSDEPNAETQESPESPNT